MTTACALLKKCKSINEATYSGKSIITFNSLGLNIKSKDNDFNLTFNISKEDLKLLIDNKDGVEVKYIGSLK